MSYFLLLEEPLMNTIPTSSSTWDSRNRYYNKHCVLKDILNRVLIFMILGVHKRQRHANKLILYTLIGSSTVFKGL